jgi:hypothetical protein
MPTTNGWVFILHGGGKIEVGGPHVADWQHFTTGPVAGFLVDDVVAATEELRNAGIAILAGAVHVRERCRLGSLSSPRRERVWPDSRPRSRTS